MTEEVMNKRVNVAQQIIKARKEKGLSINKLAELSGTVRANIYRIEKAKVSATIDTLAKLADVLEIQIII